MEYTLKLCMLNEMLTSPDMKAKIKTMPAVLVEPDGDALVVDGKRIRIIYDPEYAYAVRHDGIHTRHNAAGFVAMLQKDMDDPDRFWSELYWSMLQNAKRKCRIDSVE